MMESVQTGRKIIDVPLRPNKDLLDPEFETYKLDVRSLPVIVQDFNVGVDTWELPRDVFSYQHMKALGSHNHLFVDPWTPSSVYFFDAERRVQQARLVGQHQLETPRSVLSFSARRASGSARLHAGLVFVSDRLVCLSDGAGRLVVADTGDRSGAAADVWETAYDGCPLEDEAPFLLSHAVLCDSVLHVVLTRVVEGEKEKDKETKYVTRLEWLSFTLEEDGSCSLTQTRQVHVKDAPTFISLAPDGGALYLCAESTPQFVFDSSQTPPPSSPSPPPAPDFVWTQSAEEATVRLNVRQELGKDDVEVKILPRKLSVTIDGRLVLEGETEAAVEVDASTWTLQTQEDGRQLEITLSKAESARYSWTSLFSSSTTDAVGQEEPNPDAVENAAACVDNVTAEGEVQETRRGVDSLAQTEECDDCSDRRDFFFRVDAADRSVTHRANLSSHQWLCAGGALSPGFVLRHDVDGLVWRLTHDAGVLSHGATFSALGYLWAAKAGEIQFAGFAPDTSYAAYTALRRHVHIYRQPRALAAEMELRNRRTGRTVATVARHHVVELKAADCVLGMACTDEVVFLLTRAQLLAVVV